MNGNNFRRAKPGERGDRTAAGWCVDIDAGPLDEAASSELDTWLAASGEHEDALGRCEAAMFLGKQLAARFETGRRGAAPAAAPRSRIFAWLKSPALAWSITGLSCLATVLAFVHQDARPDARAALQRAATAPQPASARSSRHLAAGSRLGAETRRASYEIGLDLASSDS
ncbi:MAG TPA: DUF4880 domain-containing protein, partial [Gammaproteobacteria bacterium]|nr:DUF4880 domain-containing protein [Gammaproteobacteria bacterium]